MVPECFAKKKKICETEQRKREQKKNKDYVSNENLNAK
jgi:hypothetical protein